MTNIYFFNSQEFVLKKIFHNLSTYCIESFVPFKTFFKFVVQCLNIIEKSFSYLPNKWCIDIIIARIISLHNEAIG
jgi:hypothetical protein